MIPPPIASPSARVAAVLCGGLVTALAACSATDTSPDATPAPATSETSPTLAAEPLVLTLATDDSPGEISAAQITAFAARVAELSGGAIEVVADWNSNDDVPHDWDQATARLVIDGDNDLALVPSRAWDTLGVTSLQALSTPMLITDRSLEVAVITDEHLSADLLAGLPAAGVVGLGLFPEELRHPFAFGRPLLAPDDFDGGAIRAPTSAASSALYATLGATTVDDEPDPTSQLGLDSDFDHAPTSTVTINVTWYPKVNVLVANSAVWESLTQSQRTTLQEAADDAQETAVQTLPDERTAAATWCAGTGGTITTASQLQLAAIASAVARVRRQLVADPAIDSLIRAIESLKRTTDRNPQLTECPN